MNFTHSRLLSLSLSHSAAEILNQAYRKRLSQAQNDCDEVSSSLLHTRVKEFRSRERSVVDRVTQIGNTLHTTHIKNVIAKGLSEAFFFLFERASRTLV